MKNSIAFNRSTICLASLGLLSILVNYGTAIAPAAAQTPVPTQVAQAEAPGTIVDVASGNPSFSTLVTAVKEAGLVDALSSPGDVTVFAPTNEAFEALPPGVLDALLKPENRGLLTQVLTYHVAPGRYEAKDLRTGALDTLNGGLAVRVAPDRVIVNDGSVIQPDIPASNGVIHAVNRVLIPPAVKAQLGSVTQAGQSTSDEGTVRGLW
jgi:uncharacterized surface protein with fasciclin (FAS1) repeats